jgi:hypothetical protein
VLIDRSADAPRMAFRVGSPGLSRDAAEAIKLLVDQSYPWPSINKALIVDVIGRMLNREWMGRREN